MPRAMPCRALIFSCHAFISRAVLSRIRVAPLCDVPCRAMSIRLQRRSLPQRAVPCRAIMLRILWRAVACRSHNVWGGLYAHCREIESGIVF